MNTDSREERYVGAVAVYGGALMRLARGYEADGDQRQDLLQEIHLALWRSLSVFDGRCSERTWVFRVAHNAAANYIARQRRGRTAALVALEEFPHLAAGSSQEDDVDEQRGLVQLTEIVQALKPLDKQVALLYLIEKRFRRAGEKP